MDQYVCKFNSLRHFKAYDYKKDDKYFIEYIDHLYNDLLTELGIGTRTEGHDEYYKNKIMDSDERNKFEHHIEAACISKFKDKFDYLIGSHKTIEAEKHAVQLASIGNFPYVDWEIKIVSYSQLYTIRERLPSNGLWEILKAETGNTLVAAYPNEKRSIYKKITFNSKIVKVEIVH